MARSLSVSWTEVLKRLLDYLARQALEDNGGDLKEYTVGIGAFGKGPDYDPKTDSSVRVQAGKLRQKLDEYYRTEAWMPKWWWSCPRDISSWSFVRGRRLDRQGTAGFRGPQQRLR